MNKKNLVITIVVAVAVGALSFFGGMKYQQSKTKPVGLAAAGGQRQFGAGPGGVRAGRGNAPAGSDFLTGSVLSLTDNSLTVQLMGGGSKLVVFSSSTPIAKSDTGSPADLQTGKNVTIVGTDNSDGTVTARNIQIRNSAPINPAGGTPAPGQ